MLRVNATDIVVNSIKNAIHSGKLHIGDRLPKEADIAKDLGVGRSSLREGMKILAAYGVIESRQGEGTFVVDHTARNFSEFLGFFSTPKNDVYFLELRRVIEIGNIMLVYDKLGPQDFEILGELVSRLHEKHTQEEYINAELQFHNYLLCFTGNPMLKQLSEMLMEMRTNLLKRIFQHDEVVETAYQAHKRILKALEMREKEECIDAISSHLECYFTSKEISKMADKNQVK